MTIKINSDVLSRFENFRGVNMLAHRSAVTIHRLKEIQEAARREKDYQLADNVREIKDDLQGALDYLGIIATHS